MFTIICRVYKRPQTSDVVATYKLLRDQIAIIEAVCLAGKFVRLDRARIRWRSTKFSYPHLPIVCRTQIHRLRQLNRKLCERICGMFSASNY